MSERVVEEEEYYLGAYWGHRPLTVREYLAFARGLLEKLRAYDPDAFGCIYSSEDAAARDCRCYAADFSDFEERLFPQLEDEDKRYTNPDPEDDSFTLDSTHYFGFTEIFICQRDPEDETYIAVTIDTGGTGEDEGGHVVVKFPQQDYPQFARFDYVKGLFRLVVEHCRPEKAFVLTHEFGWQVEVVEIRNHRRRRVRPRVGWFTWVANKGAVGFLPMWAEYEEVGDGLMVWFSHEPVYSTDEGALEKARQLRDRLHENGYLPGAP